MTTKSLTRVIPALTKRITPISILAGFAFCFSVEAQPNSISGGNTPFPSFIPFTEAGGEGVAVDKVGNVYVSVSTMTAGQDWRDQVWKFSPSGEMSVLADLGAASGSSGLAVDAEGNVYAARRAWAPPPNEASGVFRITKNGSVSLLPGTDQIGFPNALAFDPRGNLYITETFSWTGGEPSGQGGIWRVPRSGTAELIMRHELLTGSPFSWTGFLCGANGIGWFQEHLYVANTDQATVVRIPVLRDGGLAEPEVWALVERVDESPFEAMFGAVLPILLDGLALDVHGNVYVCVPSRSAVVRIDAADRAQKAVALYIGPEGCPLDAPLSLAFGTGKGDKQALFMTNSGTFALTLPGWGFPGSGLVRAEVGAPGLPLP